MHVGIVIPAFNVSEYIGAAIRSVIAQSYDEWTITVIDDGSTDQTASVVAAFHDPRLRLIRQRNAGVSAARNRGLIETNADAVVFLDGDDWLSPGAISRLLTSLLSEPRAVASVGAYQRVSVDGLSLGPLCRPRAGDLLGHLMVRNSFANGGHMLIHRSVLEAAGPFREGVSFGEDWEYWTRIARLGPFVATGSRSPDLYVRHRPSGASRSLAVASGSFAPCMEAIFASSGLKTHFGASSLRALRRRAEAENDWVVGRELMRHGRVREGRTFLRRSVRAAPSLRRLGMFAAALLPGPRLAPFRSYASART